MNISFMRQLIVTSLLALMPFTGMAFNQRGQKVPADFKYPESQETIQVDAEIQSRSLSGVVTDPSGAAASKVLVERLRSGWKNRISAVFSNADGQFSFAGVRAGTHFLRVSKPGFNTMLLKVRVSGKTKSTLQIDLQLSN